MHTTKKSQTKLIKTVMSLAIIAGAAGAATGTYAWYSYQKDVNVDFTGTTIKADKEIQLGLYYKGRLSRPESDSDPTLHYFEQDYEALGEIETQQNVKLTDDGEADYTIYWIKGNYVTSILQNFQKYIHSAQSELHPITAGKYNKGDKKDGSTVGSWTNFMKTPSYKQEYWTSTGDVTDYKDYFYLPLAFRVLEQEKLPNGDPKYAEGENIFLSKFDAVDVQHKQILEADTSEMTEDELIERNRELTYDLSKAIRVKADYPSHDDKSDNFIFNPSAETNGSLKVGGPLNLQPDIYYDYIDSSKDQIPYGQYENEVVYKAATEADPTIAYANCTTFTANALKGGREIDLEASVPSVCETMKSYVNSEHKDDAENGYFNIAKTDGYNNVGFLDLSIYLEGWDENIVNYTAGRTFNVELEFSIK